LSESAAALKGVADMPRALSRLALNRGGPRDLGAILAGLKAATDIAALFGDGETLKHLRSRGACTQPSSRRDRRAAGGDAR
jgi:DNA mismatch repair ATPase MutS